MMNRRQALGLFAAAPVVAMTIPSAFAMVPEVYAENGIALGGTDVVGYFTQSKPVSGSADFATTWKGAEWRFANAENLAAFQQDPEAFAPQYGGYCAWAVSRNYTASTIPEAWNIHEGKLYLNFDLGIRRRFERNIERNVVRADANWPTVLNG